MGITSFSSISKHSYAQPLILGVLAAGAGILAYSYLHKSAPPPSSGNPLSDKALTVNSPGLFFRLFKGAQPSLTTDGSDKEQKTETPPPNQSLPISSEDTTLHVVTNPSTENLFEQEFVFPGSADLDTYFEDDSDESPTAARNLSDENIDTAVERKMDEDQSPEIAINELEGSQGAVINSDSLAEMSAIGVTSISLGELAQPSIEDEGADVNLEEVSQVEDNSIAGISLGVTAEEVKDDEIEPIVPYFHIPGTRLSAREKADLLFSLETSVARTLAKREERNRKAFGGPEGGWGLGAILDRAKQTVQAAPFRCYLNRHYPDAVFSDSIADRRNKKDYAKNLRTLRDTLDIFPDRRDLTTTAYNLYNRPLLDVAELIMRDVLPQDTGGALSHQLEIDIHAVKAFTRKNPRFCDSSLGRNTGKASGSLDIGFDSHLYGNLPFHAACFRMTRDDGQLRTLNMLRFPAPTVSGIFSYIAPEFRAFLRHCKFKEEKSLYNCLLKSDDSLESPRLRNIQDLEKDFRGTFHFMKCPMDGSLTKSLKFPSFVVYADSVKQAVENGLDGIDLSFIFSPEVRVVIRNSYEVLFNFAKETIEIAYGDDIHSNPDEAKKAFMMLFCTVLKEKVIVELGIDHCNETCKDAIDRGGAHLVTALTWRAFLTKVLETPKTRESVRLALSFPAYLAKTQPIIEERAEWPLAFSNFLDKIIKKEKAEEVINQYQFILGVRFDSLDFTI